MFTLTLHLDNILSPIVLRYRTLDAAVVARKEAQTGVQPVSDQFGSSVFFDPPILCAAVVADMARDAEGQVAVMAVQHRAAQTAQVSTGQTIIPPGGMNGRSWGN